MYRENEKYHTNEDFSLSHSALKARMLINLNKFIRRNEEKKEGKVCFNVSYIQIICFTQQNIQGLGFKVANLCLITFFL